MRDSPQFQQLRQQIGDNPAAIQPLIEQLAAQNPGLARALAENPGYLANLLGLDLGDEGDSGGALPPNAHVINVTEEERAAIERVRFTSTFMGIF